jgi:hypothetical protein
MLGELVGQETGQVTAIRVLPGEGEPSVEVSFQAAGTLLGTHATNIGTYTSVTRPDGTMFGEGQGVVMTESGDMASWKGEGVGHFTGEGTAVSWRGAIFYQSDAQSLARLNGIATVFEYDSDASGKTDARSYEWK